MVAPRSENVWRSPTHAPEPPPRHQHRHALARVIGGRRRRIVAVIGGDGEQIFIAKDSKERRQRNIELPKRSVKPRDVVSVPVNWSKSTRLANRSPLSGPAIQSVIATIPDALSGRCTTISPAGKQVVHLADAPSVDPGRLKRIQQRFAHRLQREVAPPRRPTYAPGLPANGRAMTRDTSCGATSMARASSQAVYNSARGMTPHAPPPGRPSRPTCIRSTPLSGPGPPHNDRSAPCRCRQHCRSRDARFAGRTQR